MEKLRRFLAYYGPHKGLFILDLSCALVVAAVDVAFPLVTQYILRTLLPADATTEIIGGPDKEFWTNGANYPVDAPDLLNAIKRKGGIENTWLGQYRYEISPAQPTNRVHFLTLLQAADAAEPQMVASTLLQDDTTDGLRFTTREGFTAELHFTKNSPLNGTILLTKNGQVLINTPLLH